MNFLFFFFPNNAYHIWAIWYDNLSLFNDLAQTVHHTWPSQRQQLCRILIGRTLQDSAVLCDGPSQPTDLDPLQTSDVFICVHLFFPLKGHFFHPSLSPFISPPCLVLLTSLTHSSKWAWHVSHCLTKLRVCGRCFGRWNLLWDTLISSTPRPGLGGSGQVRGTIHYTPWLILSVRVRSASSFMP